MGSTALVAAFLAASTAFNLPPGLLSAVCWVESSHTPQAIHLHDGNTPSHGVCQVKESTARQVGYNGPVSHLRKIDVNTMIAGAYLRYQLDRYDQNVAKAIGAFNAGSYRPHKNQKYIDKVFKAWNEER